MSILTDTDSGIDAGVVGHSLARVNLLPDEIHEARRLRRTQLVMGGVMAVVLAAVATGYVVAAGHVDTAADELAAEQQRTTALQAEQAEFADVPRVLAQVDAAQAAQQTAMQQDVLWYRYLNDLALTYPAGVWLDSLSVAVTDPAVAAAGAATLDPLATPGIGSLTIAGTGLDHDDVAAWLDVLGSTSGVADASFANSTRSELAGQQIVEFSSGAVITDEALSHRYDRKAS